MPIVKEGEKESSQEYSDEKSIDSLKEDIEREELTQRLDALTESRREVTESKEKERAALDELHDFLKRKELELNALSDRILQEEEELKQQEARVLQMNEEANVKAGEIISDANEKAISIISEAEDRANKTYSKRVEELKTFAERQQLFAIAVNQLNGACLQLANYYERIKIQRNADFFYNLMMSPYSEKEVPGYNPDISKAGGKYDIKA